MVTKPRSGLALFLGSAVLFAALTANAEEGKDAKPRDLEAEAAKVWQHNCQKCHTAPDPQFETDRGFLAQLMETS